MKKYTFFISVFALSLSLTFSACNSDNRSGEGTEQSEQVQIGTEDLENASGSLIETIRSRQDLSTFLNLVESARMVETLDAIGPYTVFAPTNEAFDKLPAGRLEQIRSMHREELKTVIGHHMMSRRLLQDDVEKGSSLDMLGGPDLPLRMENGNIMIGNARVVTQSIPARNGVIHTIDQVLVPQNLEIAR